jgi:hypothetical protein
MIAPSEASASHTVTVIGAAVLPVIFLLVLTLAEWLADAKPFWAVAVQIGWDMCILGVGLAAGLFADPSFIRRMGAQASVLATSLVLGIDLVFALVILGLKKYQKFSQAPGSLAVALGVLAVAIPCVSLLLEAK